MKNMVTEIMTAFGMLISRLDTCEERINRLTDRSIEIPQSEMQREKRVRKKADQTSNSHGQYKKV